MTLEQAQQIGKKQNEKEMKKLDNTTSNKLIIIGASVALTSTIGYFLGKKGGNQKTFMYIGAFLGLAISQGIIANVVRNK